MLEFLDQIIESVEPTLKPADHLFVLAAQIEGQFVCPVQSPAAASLEQDHEQLGQVLAVADHAHSVDFSQPPDLITGGAFYHVLF